jgi:hypothetical protein
MNALFAAHLIINLILKGSQFYLKTFNLHNIQQANGVMNLCDLFGNLSRTAVELTENNTTGSNK